MNRQRESLARSVDTTDSDTKNDFWELFKDKLTDIMPEAETQMHTLVAFAAHLVLLMSGDHAFQLVQPNEYL